MDHAEVFRNLLIMAASDGRMEEAELRLLSHRAAEWGVTDDQFEDAIEAAMLGKAELSLPPDPADRIRLLKEMIRMMAADGHLSDAEKQLFALASSIVGLDGTQLNRLIDEVLAEDN